MSEPRRIIGNTVGTPLNPAKLQKFVKSAYETAKEGGYLGTEEEFAEKLATDHIDWFGTGISIPEGADLNTYKTNGKYYCSSEDRAKTIANRPNGMNTNFVLFVTTRTTGTIKSQLIITLTGKMYVRSSSSSAWRAWVAYTTSAEIEAIRAELMADLIAKEQIVPEFRNDISECEDTNKLYVLPDGYFYGYIRTTQIVKKYTNLANNFEIGRLNSSGEVDNSTLNAVVCADYIDFAVGDVIKIKGFGALGDYNTSWYNASKTCVNSAKLNSGSLGYADYSYDKDTDTVTLTIKTQTNNYFIRFSGIPTTSAEDIVITKNEEIVEEIVDGYQWASTGHAFIPCDYEDRIINLEAENKVQAEKIAILESGATNGNGAVGVPSVWENAVDECISKIKALQVGKNCVTFPFFSDNHQRNGFAGVLISHIMKECNIPYAFYGGDSISNGTIADEVEMIAQDRAFDDAMSYIPNGRFCRAVGNHDGYWYDGTNKYYYTRPQVYELFLREESIAQNKHYGDDGTYYYVDDIASKVRWIVLNTNKENGGGEFVEATQLDWLENEALNFNESGWGVVFISHHPITNHYHANVVNVDEVMAVIDGASVDVIGWFSGHIHRDRIYSGMSVNNTDDAEGASMSFKQVTITSDANLDYDWLANPSARPELTRNMSGDTSHAIDFVTINKKDRLVSITRLGIGEDRSYTY